MKLDIDKALLVATARLICSMQVSERNPANLRIIADLLEFWSNHIPQLPKGIPNKNDNKKEAK